MVLVVLFGTLASIALGFVLAIGVILGSACGLIETCKELRDLIINAAPEILDAWVQIERSTRWIPGTRIGKMLGIELAKIIDE